MTQKNLVVCYKQAKVDDYLIEQIHSAWPEVHIINVGQNEIADALLEADYFCGHAKVPVDWDRIVAQGRLQWIQSSAAGMDWCLVPSVIASDIEITTASGALADQVAEHTLALLLASRRNLYSFFTQQFRLEAGGFLGPEGESDVIPNSATTGRGSFPIPHPPSPIRSVVSSVCQRLI